MDFDDGSGVDWMVVVEGGAAEPIGDGQPGEGVVLRYVTEAACALLGESTPSSTVGPVMRELARGYGVQAELEALPEGVLSVASDSGRSFMASARVGSLRFDQTERL